MNQVLRPQLPTIELRRRAQILTTLEEICQELELTETQFERARQAYEAVARWLADSDDPLLRAVSVYLQGSGALGTSVKPIGQDEFDVDLIAFAIAAYVGVPPATLKEAIGNRLAEHKIYAAILEEKKRCWRLNYAGDFHLDISPTIANPHCVNGGELVPDRKLREWHPTNPRAFKTLFDKRAALQPRLTEARMAMGKDEATVEPFPMRQSVKGMLRRTVQLLKRHRDIHFLEIVDEVAPISVIITTLAMRAYEYCVNRHVFKDELGLMIETIRMMPHFIDRPLVYGKTIYAVWNETTGGENFADRWNTEPARVSAFYSWHEKALTDFEAIRDAVGLDSIALCMQESLGDRVVKKVIGTRTTKVSESRTKKSLLVAPAVGLSVTPAAAAARVQSNDFYGD